MTRSLPRLACVAAVSLFAALPVAHAAPDLQWDLSYESALRAHPVAENEFLRFWPARYPQRPIHERLASYSGEPIEASLLIEDRTGTPVTRSRTGPSRRGPRPRSAPCTRSARTGASCDTPYELARDRRSEPTMRLLKELGADPKMGERCLEMRSSIRRANASP
jgi:hypothetical protein